MQTDTPTVAHVFERAAALTDQARVLREAARLAYHGDPPPAVAGWLAELRIEEGG